MNNKCTETIENIVIITSYIVSTNSVYTPEQRYEQTKKTIESVKEKIPNCYIVFIDITELNQEQIEYFKQNTDLFLNETENEELKSKVLHNKSYGEISYLMYSIDVCNDFELDYTFKRFPKLKAIYKVGARYYLNEYFDYNKFNVDKDVCKLIHLTNNNWRASHSCLFKVNKSNINNYMSSNKSFSSYIRDRNVSMEEYMYYYYQSILKPNEYDNIDTLGMTCFNTNNYEITNV